MKRHHLILILILFIGFFFRTYQIVERFEFAHDGDLYSWIIKDIVDNGHLRLIGQLTSAPGIFIGPLFYYSLIPFFAITNMDPIGALILVTLLGLLTIYSYYFVLSKIFSYEVGLIGSFLYAVLIVTVNSDRWVVPTVTTSLWAVWYLYTLVMLSRRKWSHLYLLGLLIGLIWHVHIALLPALLAVPVSLLFAKQIPSVKYILGFAVSLFSASLPFLIFELRHGMSQTLSFMNNFSDPEQGIAPGIYKFKLVLDMIAKNINSLFFSPQSSRFTENIVFIFAILLSPLFFIKKKLGEFLILYSWIIGLILFFSFSHTLISEYYFSSFNVIFIALISLLIYILFKSSTFGKILTILILSIVLVKNIHFLITGDFYNKGYLEKKAVVNFIKQDAEKKGFPCFGISYITAQGENVGFRYLFFLNKMHILRPSLEVPVYNIVIPDELSKEVTQKFGHIGIIPPDKTPSKEFFENRCQVPNTNLTESILGYVE